MWDVEEWELQEEIYWKQKARIDWLQEGDINTTFFHHSVQAHHNKGYISSLVTTKGLQISSRSAMTKEALQFYSTLFFEDSQLATEEENLILSCIPSLVTNAMNDSLLCPILISKLEEVVFGMNKGKAPSLDGFLVEFFQEFWEIINMDLLEVVKESLQNKQMLRALNCTLLTLIPNKEGANNLESFCPIGLCNVVYKIFTKLIADRLKICLPFVISEEQGSFVAGKQILDEIFIASEVFHSMHT